MIRTVFIAALLASSAGDALAQSTTRSTTTTTVTEEGNRTVTRSETTSTTVDVDGDALVDALVGALSGEGAQRDGAPPPRDWLPPGERFEPSDVFGAWEFRDRRGFAPAGCRFVMGERGFLGARGVTVDDCRGGAAAVAWRIIGSDLIIYRTHAEELDRLRYVDGLFVGRETLLSRPGATPPEWARSWADAGRDSPPRRGGWGGGWNRRLDMETVAGEWRMIENGAGGRRECRVTLTSQARFEGYGASSFGCFGALMHVLMWRIEDGRVALYQTGGGHLLTLEGDGRRLAGRRGDEEIVLYR